MAHPLPISEAKAQIKAWKARSEAQRRAANAFAAAGATDKAATCINRAMIYEECINDLDERCGRIS